MSQVLWVYAISLIVAEFAWLTFRRMVLDAAGG
jgi:hypothetical protein